MIPLALLLALTSAADAKPVVSVLYFENKSGSAELDVLRKGFADMVITDLVGWDGVTVVERGRLEDVLQELKLQQSKAFDKTTAVKVGKLVGAQYAITGSLLLAQGRLRVDATVTSIEKGDVVASATASDDKDKVFDVEQQLVDALTQAIDWKLKNREARKKAKVPNFEALIAYSKAIDLSDQGKVDEAQKAMAAVVSKSPTFLMAREKKQALLEKLKEFEARKKDLVSTAALELGRRADEELKKSFAALGPEDKRRYLFWRAAKGRFLARVLKQSLSSREESLRVIKKGNEAKALEVMRGWVENQRRYIDDAMVLHQTDTSSSFGLDQSGAYELVRDSTLFSDSDVSFDVDTLTSTLTRFIVQGRLTDGSDYSVAPVLSVLDPAELDRTLKSLADAAVRAEAAYARSTDKSRAEWPLAHALIERAEMLEYLRRDDDAAGAYQRILDLLPTSDHAKRAESKIQEIIGTTHSYDRGEREKYEKALIDCDDFYVNLEVGWRLRRKGLNGLDEIAADMEKACLGHPRLALAWGRFYTHLASSASTHDDCERAKKFYLKAFTFGDKGPRSFDFKNEPWCSYGLTEATFPSKVRVSRVSEGTHGNTTAEAIAYGLAELLGDELGARGVAIEGSGSSNGGVLGLYVVLETKDKSDDIVLSGRLTFDDHSPDVPLKVPVKGTINLDAFFAPALKVLKGKSETGPRTPHPSITVEQAVAYGKAIDLFEDQKWKEAQAAFDALAKKYPGFRLAQMRSRMAAAKAKND